MTRLVSMGNVHLFDGRTGALFSLNQQNDKGLLLSRCSLSKGEELRSGVVDHA